MPALRVQPLTPEAFAPFGQVIALPSAPVDPQKAQLFKRVGELQFDGGLPSVDFLYSPPRAQLRIDGMERHLNSTQAFIPLRPYPFIVVVSPTDAGTSEQLDHTSAQAFITDGRSGVNIGVGIWHYPMIPVDAAQEFCVVHRAFDQGLHGEFVKFRDGVTVDLER